MNQIFCALAAAMLLSGCAAVAVGSAVVGTAGAVVGTTVSATTTVAGTAIDLAIPDGDDEEN